MVTVLLAAGDLFNWFYWRKALEITQSKKKLPKQNIAKVKETQR